MKWTEEQIEAMAGSVSKWQGVRDGGREEGWEDCPCCQLYNNADYGTGTCRDCPISITTGMFGCHDTPYNAWVKFEDEWDEKDTGYALLRQEKAEAMLTFLEELLASMKEDNEKENEG